MKKLFVALTLIAILGMVGYRLAMRSEKEAAVKARTAEVVAPAVKAEAIANRMINARVVITGTIRPQNEVDITARVAGRVTDVKAVMSSKVKKGQVLAVIEPDIYALQLKQAQGALEGAKANLMTAQKNAESAETLAKTNNIADLALTQARSGLVAARAAVMQAEAAVGLARENFENTRVTSPIDGVVTRKNVSIGAMVGPGGAGPQSALFQVQNLSLLKLEASIDEKEVPFVKLGQTVMFEVDAFPGEKFEGKVALLSPSLDPVSRRASLEITINNAAGRLYANMFARGEIQQPAASETLSMPLAALVKGASTPTVYVLEGDSAKSRAVVLGANDGIYAEVREGLKDGEQVVTNGQTLLADGMKVTLQGAPAEAKN